MLGESGGMNGPGLNVRSWNGVEPRAQLRRHPQLVQRVVVTAAHVLRCDVARLAQPLEGLADLARQ
jgi:hypothetical protein